MGEEAGQAEYKSRETEVVEPLENDGTKPVQADVAVEEGRCEVPAEEMIKAGEQEGGQLAEIATMGGGGFAGEAHSVAHHCHVHVGQQLHGGRCKREYDGQTEQK